MAASSDYARRWGVLPFSAVSRPGPFGWPSAGLDTACGRLGLAAIADEPALVRTP